MAHGHSRNYTTLTDATRRRAQNNVYHPTGILLACNFGYDQIP
jgi:hypothetical protein